MAALLETLSRSMKPSCARTATATESTDGAEARGADAQVSWFETHARLVRLQLLKKIFVGNFVLINIIKITNNILRHRIRIR